MTPGLEMIAKEDAGEGCKELGFFCGRGVDNGVWGEKKTETETDRKREREGGGRVDYFRGFEVQFSTEGWSKFREKAFRVKLYLSFWNAFGKPLPIHW